MVLGHVLDLPMLNVQGKMGEMSVKCGGQLCILNAHQDIQIGYVAYVLHLVQLVLGTMVFTVINQILMEEDLVM